MENSIRSVIVENKRFYLFCVTCMKVLMTADINPEENLVLRTVAINSCVGHRKAYTKSHQIEILDFDKKTSLTSVSNLPKPVNSLID